MPVTPLPNTDPVAEFNRVFEAAYSRTPIKPITKTAKGNNTLGTTEPHFVRELISDVTIEELNKASENVYGTSGDQVIFRGGFLHQNPIAHFGVPDNTNPQRQTKRELGDALFVLYETRPGPKGHQVARRSAFMLMFKTSKAKNPGTPLGKTPIAVTSDAEQFYLYNQWPAFTLYAASGTNFYGHFDLQPVSGWSVGKYAVVWKDDKCPTSKWQCPAGPTTNMPVSWLYQNPVPRQRMNGATDSFGHLLTRFIAGNQQVGTDFTPVPPDWFGTNGWDELMGQLLGYGRPIPLVPAKGVLEEESWGGAIRDANPRILNLMTYSGRGLESFLTDHATALDKFPNLRESELHSPWEAAEHLLAAVRLDLDTPPPNTDVENPKRRGLPVLFVYVNSRSTYEEPLRVEGPRG
jgi:hypothetical protein